MNRRSLFLPFAALALAGCAPDASRDPLAPSAPNFSAGVGGTLGRTSDGGVTVPFRGTVEAAEVGQFVPPNTILAHDVGEGNATHLGRFAWYSEFTITQNLATGVGTATGHAVLTAANGDQLYATFTGTGVVAGGVATVVETYTITGGTGRFAGATGSFTMNRSVQQATTHVSTGTFSGTITLAR
jgi:hypothetical protein